MCVCVCVYACVCVCVRSRKRTILIRLIPGQDRRRGGAEQHARTQQEGEGGGEASYVDWHHVSRGLVLARNSIGRACGVVIQAGLLRVNLGVGRGSRVRQPCG